MPELDPDGLPKIPPTWLSVVGLVWQWAIFYVQRLWLLARSTHNQEKKWP